MSSVSGVNAARATLIDQLKAQQPQRQGRGGQIDDKLQSLGVTSDKIPALEKQIRDAAEAARKGAAPGQDQHAAVAQAVDKVLKDNGVDPAKFEAAMKSHKGKHHGHHKGGTQPPSTPAASAAATSSAQVDVEG